MIKEIIPFLETYKANRILKEENTKGDIKIPKDVMNSDIKYLEEDYKNTMDIKNRLEDKAKTTIATLTISITLILNISNIIETIFQKYNFAIINISISILAVLSIVYMLIAGIVSIQVLIKENKVYPLSAIERTKSDKAHIYKTTQLNINQNIVRNNMIFAAYRAIRNSVICLVILFVIAVCPIQSGDNNETLDKKTYDNRNICFGVDAVKWINENGEKNVNYDKIIDKYNKIEKIDAPQNIYDEINGVLVIVDMENDIYIVKNIISDIETIE